MLDVHLFTAEQRAVDAAARAPVGGRVPRRFLPGLIGNAAFGRVVQREGCGSGQDSDPAPDTARMERDLWRLSAASRLAVRAATQASTVSSQARALLDWQARTRIRGDGLTRDTADEIIARCHARRLHILTVVFIADYYHLPYPLPQRVALRTLDPAAPGDPVWWDNELLVIDGGAEFSSTQGFVTAVVAALASRGGRARGIPAVATFEQAYRETKARSGDGVSASELGRLLRRALTAYAQIPAGVDRERYARLAVALRFLDLALPICDDDNPFAASIGIARRLVFPDERTARLAAARTALGVYAGIPAPYRFGLVEWFAMRLRTVVESQGVVFCP